MGEPLVAVVVLVAPLGQAAAADVHGRILAQRAGEDAHQADPAQERVDGGAHHLAGQRPVRVAGQRAGRCPGEVRHVRHGTLQR